MEAALLGYNHDQFLALNGPTNAAPALLALTAVLANGPMVFGPAVLAPSREKVAGVKPFGAHVGWADAAQG